MVIAELKTLLFFPFDPTQPSARPRLSRPSVTGRSRRLRLSLMVLIGTTDSELADSFDVLLC